MERRVKNAARGRGGDLGGPEGGRGHRDGFFLTRRAGLVACANRQNRAANAGRGTHREAEQPDHHTREDVSWPCVGHAPSAPSA